MSDIPGHVERFTAELRRRNASQHTISNYGIDLREFAEHFDGRNIADLDTLALRGWLAALHHRDLAMVSIRRKLAAVRSLYRFLVREKVLDKNPARLLRTPRAPKKLPDVPTAEQTNQLVDDVAHNALERPFLERDTAIFEMLYGCGLRVSELTGLNLDDLDRSSGWIRVRGKGKKERQVPFGAAAAAALDKYLEVRRPAAAETAVFLNFRGRRLTTRAVQMIVRFYASMLSGDSSLHPHTLRHAYATHLLSEGADLRAIQELLGHARLSTTQKYTQVSLADLMTVYDKAHPKA